jgi:hypothetical protein
MWNRPRRRLVADVGSLTQTSTDCAIDGCLEGDAEFLRAPLQQSGQVIIEGQGGSHISHHRCALF